MSLLYNTWSSSLSLFKKDNFRLFLLASLNTWVRSIKIMTKNFWLLFIIIAPLCAISPELKFYIHPYSPFLIPLALDLLDGFIQIILLYIIVMTVRPSLELKNMHYYWSYFKPLWLFNFIVIFAISMFFLEQLFPTAYNLVIPIIFASDYKMLLFSLFYFDSDLSFKALMKSYKKMAFACIYFLPAFTVLISSLTVLMYLLVQLLAFVAAAVEPSLWYVFFAMFLSLQTALFHIVLTLGFSIIATYYTKIKHENFGLLFT